MSFLTRLLPMTVTYWGNPDPQGAGDYTYDAPVTFAARWENKIELFVNAAGKEQRSSAIVYSATDMQEGGYLYLGTSATANPTQVEGAFEIRAVGKSPSVAGTQTLVKAWL